MTNQLPEPTWGTEKITRDTTIPGTWRTHVVNDETFVEITDDRPLAQIAVEGPPEALRHAMLAEITANDGQTRPLTPVDIVVSDEAVDAAKLHVEASRSAGIEPDPIVAMMAEAQPLTDTEIRALQMTSEGGPADQTGEHDAVNPLEAITGLYQAQMDGLVEFHDPITDTDEGAIVEHAKAILPHIGPEATVAYLTGALAKLEVA